MISAPCCPQAASEASLRCSRLEGRYALRRVPLVRFARSDPAKPLTRCLGGLSGAALGVSRAGLCLPRRPLLRSHRGTMAHVAPVGGVIAFKLPGVSRAIAEGSAVETAKPARQSAWKDGFLHEGEILYAGREAEMIDLSTTLRTFVCVGSNGGPCPRHTFVGS
jgi:hypothetical protein